MIFLNIVLKKLNWTHTTMRLLKAGRTQDQTFRFVTFVLQKIVLLSSSNERWVEWFWSHNTLKPSVARTLVEWSLYCCPDICSVSLDLTYPSGNREVCHNGDVVAVWTVVKGFVPIEAILGITCLLIRKIRKRTFPDSHKNS